MIIILLVVALLLYFYGYFYSHVKYGKLSSDSFESGRRVVLEQMRDTMLYPVARIACWWTTCTHWVKSYWRKFVTHRKCTRPRRRSWSWRCRLWWIHRQIRPSIVRTRLFFPTKTLLENCGKVTRLWQSSARICPSRTVSTPTFST